MSSDLVILVLTIYFAGGVENTWLFFPVFIICVASYLFSLKISLIYATLSFISVLAMFLLEYFRIVPHFGIYGFPQDFHRIYPIYWKDSLSGVFLLYYITAFISGYFTKIIKESINNVQKSNIILKKEVGLRRNIETELKKHLEKLIRARTTELKQKNKKLLANIAQCRQAEMRTKTSLKEKEILLKEIHHRIKNNLQIVSSLISMQSRNIDDAKVTKAFNASQNRIKTIALIHERLYRSESLMQIDFSKYIRELTNNLLRTY